MIKRESTMDTHSVHIHDEDMEEDETSNPFESSRFEEVSTSPVFGHHHLRSSSRNLYSIPSISITMSSHHPVKKDVSLSASACLDDMNGHGGQKRNGIESNNSAIDHGHHQNTSPTPRHRNLSCLNGRNRHRSSPSTALERYCESPSTFLLDPRFDSRHTVSDFPSGTSDDDEGSNDHTLNGGRSNSRLSEATEEILFHSSVLGDSQHLRDVTVVTPTIETVVNTMISSGQGSNVIHVHDDDQEDEDNSQGGVVVGNDVVIQTTNGRGSSSEVIVSADEDMEVVVSHGEDVIVTTTTAPSVTMTVLRTCSSSPTTTISSVREEKRARTKRVGGSILRSQLLQGSSNTSSHNQLVQEDDDGEDQMCILKEPPLNHYNSNQSFVSSDTSPLSSVSTNSSMVVGSNSHNHKSIVATPAMVTLPGIVSSQNGTPQQLQLTISQQQPVTNSSASNPPLITSLQQTNSPSKLHDSVPGSGVINITNGQQPQPLDIKILPAGLIQLASNLAAVFPSSAIQSKQIAIQLLREDGTSIILPITTVSRSGQSMTGQTMTLSTSMITGGSPLTKTSVSSNIVTSQMSGNLSNVVSSSGLLSSAVVNSTSKSDPSLVSTASSKATGLIKSCNRSNPSSGLKVVKSTNPAVNGTLTGVTEGGRGDIVTPQQTIGTLLASVTGSVQSSSAGGATTTTAESDRPFKCELCSSTFTRLGNYTRHKKIHSLPTKVCFCSKFHLILFSHFNSCK